MRIITRAAACPLQAVPIDPALLAEGIAPIAQCLRSPDPDAEAWAYTLAHLARLELSAPAREALATATDRLSALLAATAAMEAAAEALACALEPVPA